MTADLPTLLQRAAELMPERFRLESDPEPGWFMVQVMVFQAWRTVYEITPTVYASTEVPADALLEYACREECEARGWDWHTHNTGPREFRRHCAQVYPQQSALSGMFQAYAPTPAHALLAALVRAVEAEEARRAD